jgi:hypothetical protein
LKGLAPSCFLLLFQAFSGGCADFVLTRLTLD